MRYEDFNSLILDKSGSICYICDLETYELLHLTRAGMRAFGLERPEDYQGKKCYEILQRRDQPCPFCTNHLLKEEEPYHWETYNQTVGRWYDLRDFLVSIEGRPCRLEIALDMTENKKEREFLSQQLSLASLLMECIGTLTTEESLSTAVNEFLATIGCYYGANRAYIFEYDLKRQVLNNTFEWCKEGVTAEIDKLQEIPLEVVDDWNAKFNTVGEFYISSVDGDLDHDSEEYRILEMQGIERLMAAPLLMGGKIVGFLGVDDPGKNFGDLMLLRATSEFVMVEMEKRRLTEELAVALERANIANQSKTKFLFNMSHDIRTPMNAILGFSMMAEKHIDDKERVLDCLSKLDSAGKHLQRLINDVLDMSRIESGKMAFDLQPHHIPSLLADNRELFAEEMKKKDLQFTVSCEVEDEVAVFDRLRMDQVELNLISNALKYTPEGGQVSYTIRQIGRTEDGRATYQGIIKDTGIGMSEEFVVHVFDAFERERTSTVDGIQGTGLGMAITKSLIDQMGGSITCKSRKGVGTEFVFTVSFPVGSEADLPRKVEHLAPMASFAEKRILLVEDNELNREIACEILEECGFRLESAEDGDIAVEMVKNSAPGYYDLILMDIQMPRMDGYTATRLIRALENEAHAKLPIIAMTANAFAEDRQNAMEAGMNEHIAKPIDVPKLMQVLQQIL